MLDIDIFIDFLLSLSRCVSLIENAVFSQHKKHEVEKRMQFPTRIIAVWHARWHTSLNYVLRFLKKNKYPKQLRGTGTDKSSLVEGITR
nr:MAG TPA: hypothetical protein [Caudoviricetes sp.]